MSFRHVGHCLTQKLLISIGSDHVAPLIPVNAEVGILGSRSLERSYRPTFMGTTLESTTVHQLLERLSFTISGDSYGLNLIIGTI